MSLCARVLLLKYHIADVELLLLAYGSQVCFIMQDRVTVDSDLQRLYSLLHLS